MLKYSIALLSFRNDHFWVRIIGVLSAAGGSRGPDQMGPGGKGLTASVHHHQAALEQDLSLLECDSQVRALGAQIHITGQ